MLALSFMARAQAESSRIVSLNPLSQHRVHVEVPQVAGLKLNVVNQPQPVLRQTTIGAVLSAYIARFDADPDPFVQAAIALYEQAGGQPIWYRANGWSAVAEDAFRILDQAEFDGLPKDKYLGKLDRPLASLQTQQQIALADFALTGESFKVAYSSRRMDEWIDGFRPETPLYLRLHKALLLGELNATQREKAALTLHRERTPPMVHPERHIIVDLGLQQLTVFEDRREVLSMPVVVGKPDRRTPLLSDKIVNLKFSPDSSGTILH